MSPQVQKLNFLGSVNAVAVTLAIAFAFCVTATPAARAQTFKVIHNFALGGADGSLPAAGLTSDAAGNFYGTTEGGGTNHSCSPYGCGTVYKLKHSGSGWVLNTLYSFAAGNDGANPAGEVAIAKDGTLYGTTAAGGQGTCTVYPSTGCGTVFHLIPSATAPKSVLSPWNETVLYRFTGGSDGANPQGDLTFDRSGNIYGTTQFGGNANIGVIFELSPSGSGWTESVLYAGQYNGSGYIPSGDVVFDISGNLYGVFQLGGDGAVYQLSPTGSSWTEQTLHEFTGGNDGTQPAGGLILDPSGNLFGTTQYGGNNSGGTVFELTPTSGGGWTFNTLYGLSCGPQYCGGPLDKLVLDASGNLYGTTNIDGAYGYGSVFKLTPSNGGWTYTSLHDFTGYADGANPSCRLVFDANGNLFGTAYTGGAYGWGVIFEITP